MSRKGGQHDPSHGSIDLDHRKLTAKPNSQSVSQNGSRNSTLSQAALSVAQT